MNPPPKKSAEELRQEAAVAAAVAQARERIYEARQPYDAATQEHVLFVRHFQEHIDAIIRDQLETAGTRILMWIIRYAWGEYALFAMDHATGFPKHQVDCARELGLKKTTVSNAVAYLQRRGYLADHAKLLIPIIAPTLTGPNEEDGTTQQWRGFCESWKVAHSTEFAELEVAEAVAKRIRKVRLAEYKKFQESEKKRRASLLETARQVPDLGSAEPSPTLLEQDLARVARKKAQIDAQEGQMHAQAHSLLFSEIERMQQQHPKSPFSEVPMDATSPEHQNLTRLIVERVGTNEEELIGYTVWVAAQFKGIGKDAKGIENRPRAPGSGRNEIRGLGLLVKWAEDYARTARTPWGIAHPAARAHEAR